MGTQKFNIRTYESFSTSVVEFRKRIYDNQNTELKISPGKANPFERGENSFSIDIHEIEAQDETKNSLRKLTDTISIELIPDLVNKIGFEEKLSKVVNNGENPQEVLSLAIR